MRGIDFACPDIYIKSFSYGQERTANAASGRTRSGIRSDDDAGKVSFPADYKGKWVILFSHPADFTPICTSEVLTFGARTAEFKALNCELIGLSVDSRNSHIAWLRTIREKIEYKGMKDIKVEFPIIDDVSMKVANLYGMIQPGESQTAAVRAVFFVDPKGVLRAMIYYPLAAGPQFRRNQARAGGPAGHRRVRRGDAGRLASGRRGDRSDEGRGHERPA